MKKAFAMGFALAVLLSGLHISISTHFCCGEIAASVLSLSGRSASCGMEGDEDKCPLPWHHLTSKCCNTEQQILSSVNLFTIPFTFQKVHYPGNASLFLFPGNHQLYSSYTSFPSFTGYFPPGVFFQRQVSPEKLCVYRI